MADKTLPMIQPLAASDSFQTDNPVPDPGVKPSGVARPRDAGELQELVRRANREGLSLVPVSSGPPHQKGCLICSEPHLVVDLSGWKKIGSIDRRNRVALIEPGVTYAELLSALAPHGLTVSMPLAPRGGKSALAAVLDREPSTWPGKQWDIADPAAGAEFIFGSGESFRTGAAGGPGGLELQRAAGGAQKSPMGPAQTDFHRVIGGSQGWLGIVTWITIRCELLPAVCKPRLIGSPDLPALSSLIYEAQKAGLGEHCFILDRTAAAMLAAPAPHSDLAGTKQCLPPFLALINLAGFQRLPEERVAYQLADLEELAKRSGLQLSRQLGGVSASALLDLALRPRGADDWRRGMTGQCLSVFFLSTLDKAPMFIEKFKAAGEEAGVAREDFGVYLQPVIQNHACHMEFLVPFHPGRGGEVERMKKLEAEAVRGLAAAGAFFSRPYGSAAALEFNRNPEQAQTLQKIKKVFDPAGVFSPGRFGL